MISVIICSKNKDINEELRTNIQSSIGVEHEIIVIDNSENKYSIFSAYNKGIAEAKYSNLCFVHEDVLFHTNEWGKKIIEHLKNKTTGIIGVAGGGLACRIPSLWTALKVAENYIQSDSSKRKRRTKHYFLKENNNNDNKQEVITLDGLFLAMRKDLTTSVRFDDRAYSGFHFYDFDICMQSLKAGFKNYVVFDVLIEHFSLGSRSKEWLLNSLKFLSKWDKSLPYYLNDIELEKAKRIERKQIKKTMIYMARIKLPFKERIEILIRLHKKLYPSRPEQVFYPQLIWTQFLHLLSIH